jgi:hypothetical protein
MLKDGATLITEERLRQIEVEGWTPEHDSDKDHSKGQLALAGAVYARHYAIPNITNVEVLWPWDMIWWKPTPNDPIRQLVKAGALIAAEIDRLQRLKEDK